MKKTNHILHLLLSLITLGAWLPVWFLVSLKTNLGNAGGDSLGMRRFRYLMAILTAIYLIAKFY